MNSNTPVLIIPGWGEDARLMRPTARLLEELGAPAIAFAADTDSLIDEACSILEMWDQKAVIIAHSKGAIDALVVAQRKSQYVKQVILVCPAGLTRPSMFRLMMRFALKCVASRPRQLAAASRYALSAPKRAFFIDPKTIINGTSPELIYEVQEAGIQVTILASDRDRLFPLREIFAWLKAVNLHATVDLVRVLGVHDDIHLRPHHYREAFSRVLFK